MKNDLENCGLILVFKTNLAFKKDIKKLSEFMGLQQDIIRWNVDLSDVDRILRIEPAQISANKIIEIVAAAGYSCEELTD